MTDEPKTEVPTAEVARPANTAVIMPRAPLRGGAPVVAIIPTDLEQVWRIATMAVSGAMAPDSLLKEKSGGWKPLNDAISACAIAIMAGAEMGLTPLSALRSYAVVNGRPTLWGDGVKAVVRQSGLCEYIKTGSDENKGWCESKRKDTGEVQRKEFTIAQAKKANLLSKKGPWQEYPDMMMERRATFRCLNDLYADVLAGIVSAEEANDYSQTDDAPIASSQRAIAATPPEPPPEDEDQDTVTVGPSVGNGATATIASVPGAKINTTDPDFDFDAFKLALAGAHNTDEIDAVMDEFAPQVAFADDEVSLTKAFDMKKVAEDRLARPTEADGQDEFTFPGDRK